MRLDELEKKSIVILGLGTEGQATYEFLRRHWPSKPLTIADRKPITELPEDLLNRLQSDIALRIELGPNYLDSLETHEVIIKTPGIPASLEGIVRARQAGALLTSHSQIFLSNYSRDRVIGITGTKGKSTTASLIHHILKHAGFPAELVGNIGQPPLSVADSVSQATWFVHEFSSHQLVEIETSPHIAVLLNIVPEHLDYYPSFEEYVAAKENITKFQSADDFLVFPADYRIPREIAQRSKAILRPFSTTDGIEQIINTREIPLAGKFNLLNVAAAIVTTQICGVPVEMIGAAIRSFHPLPHRLEPVGVFRHVSFYDDSIATVPEATLAALDALGPNVQTLLLGGHERNLDFTSLGEQLPANIRTVILFPPSGVRIWKAIESSSRNRDLPAAFFVRDMEQAVKIAFDRTEPGKICLLSPASPSFGTFKDYKERGDLFKAFIKKFSSF